jgi:hypothetical protein
MSIGNIQTETKRRALAGESAILEAAALVNNAVLRRALAIAAYEMAGKQLTPDAGIALMIDWVMRASDEVTRESEGR